MSRGGAQVARLKSARLLVIGMEVAALLGDELLMQVRGGGLCEVELA